MPDLILRHGAWLLICDGQRALLLQNTGDMARPRLEIRETFQQDNPLTHVQGSAPPGRVFASGERRAATEETDLHRQVAEQFLDSIAKLINQRVEMGAIAHLGIAAPARALGILRLLLSDQTRKVLIGELARDYAGLPVHEIEQRLAKPALH